MHEYLLENLLGIFRHDGFRHIQNCFGNECFGIHGHPALGKLLQTVPLPLGVFVGNQIQERFEFCQFAGFLANVEEEENSYRQLDKIHLFHVGGELFNLVLGHGQGNLRHTGRAGILEERHRKTSHDARISPLFFSHSHLVLKQMLIDALENGEKLLKWHNDFDVLQRTSD